MFFVALWYTIYEPLYFTAMKQLLPFFVFFMSLVAFSQNVKFNMYPNPCNSEQTFESFESNQEITEIEFFNIIGNKVIHEKPQSKVCLINISHIPTGSYIVRISTMYEKKSIKFIKN